MVRGTKGQARERAEKEKQKKTKKRRRREESGTISLFGA